MELFEEFQEEKLKPLLKKYKIERSEDMLDLAGMP